MAEITWKSILTKLVGGDHLSAEESEWFVDDLMQGNADPAAVGAALAMQEQLGLTPTRCVAPQRPWSPTPCRSTCPVRPPTSSEPAVTASPP